MLKKKEKIENWTKHGNRVDKIDSREDSLKEPEENSFDSEDVFDGFEDEVKNASRL